MGAVANRRAALLLAALTIQAAAAPSRAPAALEAPRIAEIRFEGNAHVKDGALRSRMRLRQPSWWNPFSRPTYPGNDFLAGDLRQVLGVYEDRGFPFARITDARVHFDESGERVSLVVSLEEGPRITLAGSEVRGIAQAERTNLARRTLLRPGRPLSWRDLSAEGERVRRHYVNRGHALAASRWEVRHELQRAWAILHVAPGPLVRVDTVVVEGLEQSREVLVRRELMVREGDWLRADRLLRTQERLLDTGVFERVRLVPEFADSTRLAASRAVIDSAAEPSAQARLRIVVDERKGGWYGGGAGYSSGDRLRFLGEWGRRNLAGLGRRFTVNAELDYSLDPDFRGRGPDFREANLHLDYVEPWLFGIRLQGLLSPFARWIQEAEFHQVNLGAGLTFRREISRVDRVSLGLQSKYVRTTEEGVVPRYTTNNVRLEYTEDSRDDLLNPSDGQFLQGALEYAGGVLGGRNEFERLTANWHVYLSPADRWTVAARLKGGEIQPFGRGPVSRGDTDTLSLSRVPWEERFRVGGGTTIRGYGEDLVGRRNEAGRAIGGRVLLLANVELRFPVFSIVQGAVFLDGGNVWADPAEFKLAAFSRGLSNGSHSPLHVAYGAGGGIRVLTPVGPFRVDYGVKVGSGRAPGEGRGSIHVALGQAF